jgi:hypothetical protein
MREEVARALQFPRQPALDLGGNRVVRELLAEDPGDRPDVVEGRGLVDGELDVVGIREVDQVAGSVRTLDASVFVRSVRVSK